jgi:purine-cytosine permease-like protein
MAANGEFEREPVPDNQLLGFKSFLGMYAGEHCAGTELMLGPLFVAAGVSAFDLIVGLLLGNLLAVLSWTFLTAPIATRARLTLYYQLEKICGEQLVTLYNLANGVMFCFLAGAMITVSATAVGVWTDLPMPELDAVYPNGAPWVITVLVLGALISVVAAYGYKAVANFANLAAPWMVLVFLAFGIVGLKQFIDVTGAEINSAGDLWTLATDHIWKGGEPLPGQSKFTFWHVMFFGWFCNMAMHIGMSDLSVFRFAKHSWYGLATASGMYVGHYMAWISASILYALQLHNTPENTAVLPGPLANQACGVAGLICVIVAGWTTANPTIYRAGLAFQAVMPKVSRFKVTLATGLLATIAGMFPLFAMSLLGFVAIYGLILMPMGAVVFADFWLFSRLGLKPNFADKSGIKFNWAAGVAWLATIAICVGLNKSGIEINGFNPFEIFFVSLPGWFIATLLYIGLSYVMQNELAKEGPFRRFMQIASWAAIAGIMIPPIVYLQGGIESDRMSTLMLVATGVWFASTALLLSQNRDEGGPLDDEIVVP